MKPRKNHMRVSHKEHVGIPINRVVSMPSCDAVNDIGIPVHIVTKKEIEDELSRTEELYGMSPEKFYKAWKNNEIHDFHAIILGNLYESYMQRHK